MSAGCGGVDGPSAARWIAALALTISTNAVASTDVSPAVLGLRIVGDGIPQPLVAGTGDPARGRMLIVARESANCVLCHAVPDAAVRFAGDIGPSLAGVGARLSVPQLRLRVSDNLRVNPTTIMPSYYKVAGLDRVASQYDGKPILTAQEVEDVVAYLAGLR